MPEPDSRPPLYTAPAPAPAHTPLPARTPCAPQWRSSELLAGQREATIEHAGTIYRLRLTSLGKLILTK